MKKTLILAACLITVLPSLSPAQSALDASRKIYRDGLEKMDSEYRKRLRDVDSGYGKYLSSLSQSLQKKGDLEGVLAARNEVKRFETEGSVPAQADPALSPAIVLARGNYHQAVEDAGVERSRKIVAFTKHYESRLESLKKELTTAGKIEEALAVKAELEALEKNERVTSAKFDLIARAAESKEPEAPAAEVRPPSRLEPVPPSPPVVGEAARMRVITQPVVHWSGHNPSVRLRALRGGAGMSELSSDQGNILERGGLLLKGGRTHVEGIEEVLLHHCKERNELGIRLVFTTENLKQSGPARIMTFSKDGHNRNFSICQENDKLLLRLRTTRTGPNGTKPEVTLCTLDAGKRTDIVVAYGAGKGLQFFKDGLEIKVQQIEGDFSNWEHFEFVLGNEASDDRPWRGVIHLFMIGNSSEVRAMQPMNQHGQPQTLTRPRR